MRLLARIGLPVVGALVVGPLALGPAGAAGAASGPVCMGVVVDDGGYNGSGPAAVQSANVSAGSSDLQALQTAGDTAYQNNSGLVCAIDDGTGEVPANGLDNCLATSGNGQYFYWSYWHGDPYTDTWTYANDAPASHTTNSGQTYVEGWRYQNPGPDNPTASPPSVKPAAAFALACPGVTPAPSGGSGGIGGGSGSGSGSGGGTVEAGGGSPPASGSSPAAATPTTTAAGTGSAGSRTAVAGASNTTTTTSHSCGATGAPPGAAPGASTTAAGGAGTKSAGGKIVSADPRPHSGPGGGDPALPILVVAVVIASLGGLAWWRWRRRPLEE